MHSGLVTRPENTRCLIYAEEIGGAPGRFLNTRGMKPAGSSQWEALEVTEISIVEIERILKKKDHRYSFGKNGCICC